MASDGEASCESDPNFAVICGFLEKFGVTCGITNIDFVELQEMLENTQEVSSELSDLHIKLLRKARKSVSNERWERAVIKLCHTYCSQDAWEIERFGYKKARLASKLRILKELLEMQFDFNPKFKTEINKMSAEELRTQPLGKDRLGYAYWLQCDNSCQIRVYREDSDEETWALVAKDREGLASLITQLKTNDTIKVGLEPIVNEDSNSLEVEKPIIDTGQATEESGSEDEQSQEDTKKEEEEEEDVKEEADEDVGVKNGEETKSEEINEDTALNLSQKPTLRIKSISELMSSDVQPELVGVKDKYIRAESNIDNRPSRLKVSTYSSPVLHRKAIHSAGFDTADLKTTLKRTAEEEDDETIEDDIHDIKRSRLNRPTLLGNKKPLKTYSDDEIEEPVMVIRGEGSGRDNECANPIVSEAIEEEVMYFCGEGNGEDCGMGNDEKEDRKTENSINAQCKCVNSVVDNNMCECGSRKTVRNNQFKLGTIIDVRMDNNSFKPSLLKSPMRKSRWDIGKPPDEIDNDVATPNDDSCFKIPHSKQLDVKTSLKGKTDSLSGCTSKTKENVSVVDAAPMQPVFFFGPGCLQVKPSVPVLASPNSQENGSEEKQKLEEITNKNVTNEKNSEEFMVNDAHKPELAGKNIEQKESQEVIKDIEEKSEFEEKNSSTEEVTGSVPEIRDAAVTEDNSAAEKQEIIPEALVNRGEVLSDNGECSKIAVADEEVSQKNENNVPSAVSKIVDSEYGDRLNDSFEEKEQKDLQCDKLEKESLAADIVAVKEIDKKETDEKSETDTEKTIREQLEEKSGSNCEQNEEIVPSVDEDVKVTQENLEHESKELQLPEEDKKSTSALELTEDSGAIENLNLEKPQTLQADAEKLPKEEISDNMETKESKNSQNLEPQSAEEENSHQQVENLTVSPKPAVPSELILSHVDNKQEAIQEKPMSDLISKEIQDATKPEETENSVKQKIEHELLLEETAAVDEEKTKEGSSTMPEKTCVDVENKSEESDVKRMNNENISRSLQEEIIEKETTKNVDESKIAEESNLKVGNSENVDRKNSEVIENLLVIDESKKAEITNREAQSASKSEEVLSDKKQSDENEKSGLQTDELNQIVVDKPAVTAEKISAIADESKKDGKQDIGELENIIIANEISTDEKPAHVEKSPVKAALEMTKTETAHPSTETSTKRNLRDRKVSDTAILANETETADDANSDEPSKKISKLETPEKSAIEASIIEEGATENTPKETDKKQLKAQKKSSPKKLEESGAITRRTTRSSSLKTEENKQEPIEEENKEEPKPVDEPKCVKIHVPLLTLVNISELTNTPEPETIIANDTTDSDDIVAVPESDPLACSEEEEAEEPQKDAPSMNLSTFSLDVDTEVIPFQIPTRSTRKRGHETITENTEVAEKKQKLKGKRSIDTELRRSIEEQKRLQASSSDDDNGAQDTIVIEDEEEEEEEQAPKKVIRKGRRKKMKRVPPKRVATRSPVSSSDVLSETSRADSVNTPPVSKKGRGFGKKKTLLGLEIPAAIENVEEPVTGVRQSRRIAQIKIKEEAERRKLEEIALNEIQAGLEKTKDKKEKKKKQSKSKPETKKRNKRYTDDEDSAGSESADEEKKRKRKHRHPNKIFDESNPWKSSSSDSSTSNEDEEEEEYSEEEPSILKSDHEFSPESDMEDNADVQPMKRARTARKESDVEEVDDCACQKCGQTDHPEWILLCDGCDNGWHCSCLRPALLVIPEGDWYCPPCQHMTLIKNLEKRLVEYDKQLRKKGIEDRRKERLAYVGFSLNNVLPAKESEHPKAKPEKSGSKSDESESGSESGSSTDSDSEPIYQLRERRQAHSYRFNDYDELINSAIQDEMEAVKGAGNQGKGKDIATIVNAEKEEEAQRLKMQAVPEEAPPPVVPQPRQQVEAKDDDDEDSDDAPIRPVQKKFGRKKPRKLNSLDVSSGDDADSDEDFKGTSSTDEEEEFDDAVSESSEDSTRYGRRRGGPVRRSTRARTSRYDREFINDDESDEDEAPRRKKTRSIWDESEESEESDRSWGRKKRKVGGRTTKTKPVSKSRRNKKKKKEDSDSEFPKLKKKPKIKYGRIESDEENTGGRRTRGKKINYLDVLGSDDSDDGIRRKAAKPIESEDEYVVNEEDELEQEQEDMENEKLSDEENQSDSEDESAPATIPKLKVKPLKAPTPEPEKEEENENMKRLAAEMQATVDSFKDSSPTNNATAEENANEPNPIDEINKNMEEMNEQEMEKMMEEEEYANKQLQLVALQIEKEKKRKEREAKKLEMLTMEQDLGSKKRTRKAKNLDFPPIPHAVSDSLANSELQNNAELSEPPGVSLPMFGDMGGFNSSPEDTPKKRRGRGKGKKTLAAEQAAAIETAPKQIAAPPLMPAQDPALQGNNIGIAAPPQPFSQSQPAPSVITRMLQSQPGQGGYPVTGSPVYYPPRGEHHGADAPPAVAGATPVGQQYVQPGPPRGVQVPNPYRQGPPPPGMPPHYPPIRATPTIPHQVRPPAPPHHYHQPHRPMDPSPSGGGSMNMPTDRTSPAIIPPPSDSPGRPPPQIPSRFPPANGPAARHLHMMSPHAVQPPPSRTNSMAAYPPPPHGIPGAYYNSYPVHPQTMGAGEEMMGYQSSSPYSEQFSNEGAALGEGSNSKSFEEESGGEFGGLVSYFSSQREDDLDT